MPELPEVETVARQLERKIKRRTIRSVSILDYRLNKLQQDKLKARVITAVRREGKQICFELGSGGECLLIHLRMTGRLVWVPSRGNIDNVGTFLKKFQISDNHVRVQFRLSGGTLLFVDPRRFGTISYFAEAPSFNYVDPLTKEFSVERLLDLSKNRRQNLKQFLLRQDLIVGIGNIYASEILFRAGLNPWMKAAKLRHSACERLHREIKRVLNAAIKLNGTTFSDFQDTEGSSGGFSKLLKVYGRSGELCRCCRTTTISRKVQSGRSTFYCSTCQPRIYKKATR